MRESKLTPKEKAKYLKIKLPKSYMRYVNMRILEHEDKSIMKTKSLEYWEQVKTFLL